MVLGRYPCCNDVPLCMAAGYQLLPSEGMSELDLTKDFDGDAIITRRTSSSVTGWKTSFIAMAETRVRWRDTISGNTDVIDLLAEVLSKAVSSQKCRTLATGLVTTKQIIASTTAW